MIGDGTRRNGVTTMREPTRLILAWTRKRGHLRPL
jgi:hypothetical protein